MQTSSPVGLHDFKKYNVKINFPLAANGRGTKTSFYPNLYTLKNNLCVAQRREQGVGSSVNLCGWDGLPRSQPPAETRQTVPAGKRPPRLPTGTTGRKAVPTSQEPASLLPVPGVRREEMPEAARAAGSVEQLADALVQAAQEVHVGRAPVQPLVLHQPLPERHLRLLSLLHDHQLGDSTGSGYTLSGLHSIGSHVTKPHHRVHCEAWGCGSATVRPGGSSRERRARLPVALPADRPHPQPRGKGRPLWPGGPRAPTLPPRDLRVQWDNPVSTACSSL